MFRLAGPKWGPLWCWVSGWLNLLGQIASLTASAFLNADLIGTLISMASVVSGREPPELSEPAMFGIFAAVMFVVAALNSAGLRILTLATQVGAVFHLVGVLLLVVVVPAVSPTHNSASFVFTTFYADGGIESGIPNYVYIACLGLLLPAWSYTGMDGPAHMAEEVAGSQTGPAKAIITGALVMWSFGGLMLLSLLFSMGPIADVLSEDNISGGNPLAQILYDVFNARGMPGVGVALLIIPILGIFFCTLATMTYVSRILFCYSRDRAVPLSWLWQRVDARTQTPIIAVWAVAIAATLLGLPRLGDETAFLAILSLSTIALIIVYTLPTFVRITFGAKRFVPGPFNLGRWTYLNGALASGWAAAAAVIFCLPTEYPVTSTSLNYASIAFLGTLFLSLVWFWFPKVWVVFFCFLLLFCVCLLKLCSTPITPCALVLTPPTKHTQKTKKTTSLARTTGSRAPRTRPPTATAPTAASLATSA